MKSKFIQIPAFYIGGKGQWILADRLIYQSELLGERVVVPEKFETDLASIPKVVPRRLIDVNGHHRAPAVVHDWLCRQEVVYRPLADHVFLEAMKVTGVKRWRRYTMWFAVRCLSFFLMNFTKRYRGGKDE